jgi:hypothetical protein
LLGLAATIGSQGNSLCAGQSHDEDPYRSHGRRQRRKARKQTRAGKGWFAIFCLYGPLEPWFGKTWRPGEIQMVK